MGEFRIEERLGDGGTATVYRARDARGRPVALKIPHAAELEDRNFLASFRREAEVGLSLTHPAIVRTLAVGEYELNGRSIPYFAMEFLEGASLATLIREEGRLDAETAARLAYSVADALDWAHSHRVVHRDITPNNIFVTRTKTVKVMDFGIAAISWDLRARAHKALTHGTPAYLAPERIDQPRSVDPRSDLYSLGCVLFEMLTGHPPYQAAAPEEILKMHQGSPIPRAGDEAPVPPALERICQRLLAKDPAGRYQSAREVMNALADLRPVY